MNFKLFITPVLVLIGFSVFGQWNSQNSPTQSPITAIHFVDDNVGFVGSGYGIHKTTNGGTSWSAPTSYGGEFETQLLANALINDFYFFNSQKGFMVGGGYFNAFDIVAKTTDGGVTWSLVYFQAVEGTVFRETVNSITFVNSTTGFAVGGKGRVVKTTDGGDTWTDISLSTTKTLRSVYFLDSEVGFISGEDILFKTTDGGATWSTTGLTAYKINDFHFYDLNNGVASTEEGSIITTTDGGDTWTKDSLLNFSLSLTDISFVGDVGYILGNNASYQGFVFKTSDKGATWEQQTISNSYGTYALTTTPNGNVWAGAYAGKLFKTTNGGGPSTPIVSFSAPTDLCEDQSYTFKNYGYNSYTYEWRIDNVLVSTSYDLTTTLTSGQHTIELTAINGNQKSKKSITQYVDSDVDFNYPLDVTFPDGICTGSSTTIKVRIQEWAEYELYLDGVKVGSKVQNYPYYYFTTPALTNTTTFTVKATRSNRCKSVELSKDVTVSVYPYPSTGSILSVVQPDICNEGETAIQIADSRSTVQYHLFAPNGWNPLASVVGTGGNALLTTPHLTDTTQFVVKGSVMGGTCESWFTDTLTVNVEKVSAAFQLSYVNVPPGEPVSVFNTSVGATNFTWDFSDASDLKTSSAKDPGAVTFTGIGTVTISLQTSSASGCSSETERTLTLYDNSTMDPSCWATELKHTRAYYYGFTKEFQNLETAPNGDLIVAGPYYQYLAFNSENHSTLEVRENDNATFLARYSPEGVLKWVIPNVATGNGPLPPRLSVSPDGSIYMHVASNEPTFYSVYGPSRTFDYKYPATHFLVKYSPEGVLVWAKSFDELQIAIEWQYPFAVDTDAEGNVYVANEWVHKITPDGERLWSSERLLIQQEVDKGQFALAGDGSWYFLKRNQPLELSRYSKAGVLEWSKEIGVTTDWGLGQTHIGADNSGNLVFMYGEYWQASLQLPGSDDTTPSNMWIAKFTPEGSLAWVNKALELLYAEDMEVSRNGTINLQLNYYTWDYGDGTSSIQSQDGSVLDLNFVGYTPILVTYNTDGMVMRSRVFRDPAPKAECVLSNIDIAAYNDDVYVIGFANCGESIINGDIIHADGDTGETPTMYIAKFAMGCDNTPSKIDAMILGDDPDMSQYCAGTTVPIQVIMNGSYPIYDNNVYKIYLSNEGGYLSRPYSTLIGELETTSTHGVIDVVIPDNVVYGAQYYFRVLVESDPELYSAPIPFQKYLSGAFTPDFDYFINDLRLTMVPKGRPGIEYQYVINEQDTVYGDLRWSGTADFIVPKAGTYTVCMTVTDECGTKGNFCKEIAVSCDVMDKLNITYTTDGKTVTISTTGNPNRNYTFLWKFSDNTTSTEQSPVHTFPTYGNHSAAIEMFNECGSAYFGKVFEVACPQIDPAIVTSADEKIVTFENSGVTESPEMSTYLWSFGDGSTSTERNPLHVYSAAGTYTVTLKETNECSSKTVSISLTVVCPNPIPNFTKQANNLHVSFTNVSENYSSVYWTFGDGFGSTQESPEHTYTTAGTYTVTLTATNHCGSTEFSSQVVVDCPKPTLSFTHAASKTVVSFTSTFDNTSLISWDFGDGTTASGSAASAEHTYAAVGTYTVCLSAENACGTEQICKSIEVVCPVPEVDFDYEVDDTGLQVTFTNLSSNYSSLRWILDGTESSEESPTHIFEPGVHEVCLEAENECGTESVCQNVVVVLTGRESELSKSITLYPNPVTDHLLINTDRVTIDRIEVITGLGVKMHDEVSNFPKNEIKINTQPWKPGEYILILTIGTEKEVRKIVVKR